MTQYKLTTNETQLILNQSKKLAALPLDMSWIPTKQIPDALLLKDYEITRPDRPMGSKYGEAAEGVRVSRLETETAIISYRYTSEFNKTELAIAARNGYALVAENNAALIDQMQLQIAKLFAAGSNLERDRVNISGAFTLGEDVNAALDTVYWDTATKPVAHVAAGVGDLLSNGYAPPYTMLIPWHGYPGMAALNDAANPRSHRELALSMYQTTCVFWPGHVASGVDVYGSGGWKIKPIPKPTTDDIQWAMFKVDPSNFFLAQVTNGIELSPMVFDPATNMYSNYVEWRGTPMFAGSTLATAGSADYIVFEPDVDFAA